MEKRVFSPEHRARLSAARRLRVTKPETREKIGRASARRGQTEAARQKLAQQRNTNGAAFWSKVDRSDIGCWEWRGYRQAIGYGVTAAGSRVDGSRRTVLAHRRSYELTVGPIPEGMMVLHHCDNRGCVRPDHLYLGDQSANMRDREERGRANHQPKKKS